MSRCEASITGRSKAYEYSRTWEGKEQGQAFIDSPSSPKKERVKQVQAGVETLARSATRQPIEGSRCGSQKQGYSEVEYIVARLLVYFAGVFE